MSDWGIYALFLMTFFEAALLLGIFIPGESMVIAAGVAASRGALDLTDVVGRFTSVLRAFAPLVAGTMKMDYPKFLLYDVTGGVLWAASFAALGYFAGEGLDVYMGYLSGVFQALAVALALAASYMLYRFLKKREAAVLFKEG